MNIVLISDLSAYANGASGNGRAFVWIAKLAEELRALGHHVTLVSPSAAADFVVPSKTRRQSVCPGRLSVGVFDDAQMRDAMGGADIVHFVLPHRLCIRALKAADALGIPTVASYPSAAAQGMLITRLGRLRKPFYRHVQHIHCPTEQDAQEMRRTNTGVAIHVADGAQGLGDLYLRILAQKALSTADDHKIHLKQTKTLHLTEDYTFVNHSPLFLALSWLFKIAVIYPVFLTLTRVALGFRARGRRNLRAARNGAVTVSNHVHMFDAPMLNFAMFPRQPVMTSMKGNFETPGIRFLVRILGATPIPETPKALGAFMRAMGAELDRGRLVHFYPEAALWPGHTELRPFKNGAFHLAVTSGKPVLPLIVKPRPATGIWRLYKKKPCITIVIGRPVAVPESGSRRQRIETLKARVFAEMETMLVGDTPAVSHDAQAAAQ